MIFQLKFAMIIWTPIIVSVGTILNCLTIMVFSRTRIRKSFLSMVMISLSIADICVLLNVFFTWLDERYFTYYFFDNTICKFEFKMYPLLKVSSRNIAPNLFIQLLNT